jgi:energy-converting hydrogenase Eha subunit E
MPGFEYRTDGSPFSVGSFISSPRYNCSLLATLNYLMNTVTVFLAFLPSFTLLALLARVTLLALLTLLASYNKFVRLN